MSRKLLIVFGSILGLIVLVILAIPFFVNAEKFRPMVETEARKALGREVKVGKLDLSILSGGVVASDVSIADDPAFSRQPFLQAKELQVGVELWPLITSGEARVTGLTVVEPSVTLIRNGAGKWNFATLGAASAKDAKAPKQAVSVSKLQIKDGHVVVQQGGRKHEYSDVSLTLRNFSNTSVFPFEFSATAPGGGKIAVEGEAGPMDATDTSRTPLNGQVKITGMDIAKSGFVEAGSGIGGMLDFDGTAKSDGKTMHSEGKVTVNKLVAAKGGSPAAQPVSLDYATDLDVVQKKGTITRGDITAGASKAKLTGTFDTRGESIAVDGRLKADAMSIDGISALLPAVGVTLPSGSQVRGGTASADLSLRGPLDRLVIAGPINVSNTKVEGFNLRSRASALSALAGMSSGSDLLVQLLNSNVRVAPEGIRTDGVNLVLPGIGTITGDGVIGSDKSLNYRMRAKLAGGGGVAGGLSALTTLGQSKGEIPFLIQGTTSNPVFLPDVAGAIGNTAKAPVQTLEGIGGLFGIKKKKQ
ncbi:MAG: AsmA family protein [Acidobacteriales bacterium]|nr:AsmA family protein [Terriglobales bacterium]